jgi:hypothetical protein
MQVLRFCRQRSKMRPIRRYGLVFKRRDSFLERDDSWTWELARFLERTLTPNVDRGASRQESYLRRGLPTSACRAWVERPGDAGHQFGRDCAAPWPTCPNPPRNQLVVALLENTGEPYRP